jgi:hypothetical protein
VASGNGCTFHEQLHGNRLGQFPNQILFLEDLDCQHHGRNLLLHVLFVGQLMKKLAALNVTAKIHSSGIKKLSQVTDKICQIKIRRKSTQHDMIPLK